MHGEYERWLEQEGLETELREELLSIRTEEKEIRERFYTELEFGTAGLRGILGAGTNRMNLPVVRRASRGLADYLLSFDGAKEKGVAIAYDSRHKSDVFAKEAALVLAAAGIRVYLYESLRSVPQLSYTVLKLGCAAGIVITASHNPPQYNGYKVYWSHGGQAGPAEASAILACIRKVDYFAVPRMEEKEALEKGLLSYLGEAMDEAYFQDVRALLSYPELLREKGKELKLVYTPLHGSGRVPVEKLLKSIGIVNFSLVAEQAEPDGDFPTVKAPNPEDPNAFTLARKLADATGADAILATDPDADRLGVAVRRKDGEFSVLTGNQIGCLLLYYILSTKKAAGRLPENGLVVKSIVSTRLADAICAHYGVEIADVLTGFRFIAEKIARCEETGEQRYLFGFEESFGFLAGSYCRDKDAICSAMLLSEACVYYREQGKNLYDVLQEIYARFGFYKESVKSYTLMGMEGIAKIQSAMEALRKAVPFAFGEEEVLVYEDLKACEKREKGVETVRHTGLPSSNVLRYTLKSGAWIVVRPSGTEPKLKLYIGANAKTEEAVDAQLERLTASADALLSNLLA